MLKFLVNTKSLCFLGGIASSIIAKQVAKSKVARQLAVTGIAKGMNAYDEAKAAVNNIREDAEDLYAEAKAKKIEEKSAEK